MLIRRAVSERVHKLKRTIAISHLVLPAKNCSVVLTTVSERQLTGGLDVVSQLGLYSAMIEQSSQSFLPSGASRRSQERAEALQ
jgi:hypothetical protein